MRPWMWALGTGLLLALGFTLAGWSLWAPAPPPPAPPLPASSSPLSEAPWPPRPPAPPCIHYDCRDRPHRLNCVGWSATWRSCDSWAVEYENHCDCDTWGPAPPPGAPP